MLGKLLSTVTKVATLPLDVANITLDVACGGDGSKRSRSDSPLGGLEDIRDQVAESMEEFDED